MDILEKMKEDYYRYNRNEHRVASFKKDSTNINIGKHSVEAYWFYKKQIWDRRNNNGKFIIYKFMHTDSPIQSFMDRLEGVDRKKQHKLIEKEILYFVSSLLDVDEQNIKLKYDVFAGCSCPCSPGWLLTLPQEHKIYDNPIAYPYRYELHIKLNRGEE